MDDHHDDKFPGFPVGETRQEFEAAIDRLMDWRGNQTYGFAYGQNLPKRWGDRHEGHILACARMPVARLMHILPPRFIEALEQNQLIAHCCRHPENHQIEAWFSCAEDEEKGIPDIYINHCTCGRRHFRFMVGGGPRPFWEAR